jgi:hypothetical protein
MPRLIEDRKIGVAHQQLVVQVTDEPGHGGANHWYEISGFRGGERTAIVFQNGTIPEVGVNGLTHEVLLAVLIDRLRCFQAGQFACRENALALTKLEEAMQWLHQRTVNRLRRGVEGTHKV